MSERSAGGMVALTSAGGEAGQPAGLAESAAAHPAPRSEAQDGPVIGLGWALLAALAGGLALAAAFPPIGIWPLTPLGPALLVVALWRRRARWALAAGLVFGLALFLPLLSWLINLAWYAWAALAVSEAVIFAVLALGQRLLLGLRAWPLAVAGWWVLAEAVRDRWPWGGFPWGRLAMSQAGAPTAGWVAVGGPAWLSFLLGLTGAALAWALVSRARRRRMAAAATVASAGLCLAGGLIPAASTAGAPTAVVAAVQGDVPHERNLPDLLRATTVTANHAAATLRLAREVRSGRRPAPDVVIWPENSTDLDPALYPSVHATIAAAVNAIGRPVLVGAVLQDPLRNAGQLWVPGAGPVADYLKRQLVPFGEYIPFRGLLSRFTSLVALQPHDFTPGRRPVVFGIGRIRLGDVICYEVAFDNLVSSEVAAGANLIAAQSNDATFEMDGQRGETLQQLAMARIRAVETGRSVVLASTTGVSAIIAPDGRLLAHSGTWRQAVLEAKVPLLSGQTMADRVGAWPEYVIVTLAAAALAWAGAGAFRRARASRRGA